MPYSLLLTAFTYSYFATVKIGQFIVNTLKFGLGCLCSLFSQTSAFSRIVFEDFIIFLHDVWQNIICVIDLLKGVLERSSQVCTATIDIIKNAIFFIMNIGRICYDIISSVTSIPIVIGNIFLFIKYILISFGNGVWFIIAYIPKSIVNLIAQIIDFIALLFVSMSEAICNQIIGFQSSLKILPKKICIFVIDTPIESLLGILIGITIIFIFLKLSNKLFFVINAAITSVLRNLYRKIKPKHWLSFIFNKFKSNDNKMANIHYDSTSVCIICQEKARSILTLPCRHLCMCEECSKTVLTYNRSCPLCRQRIQKTVKVFL